MQLKIAIMGIRGIPANYGGFETFAENLATRLVKQGHEVTVYGRRNNIDFSFKYYHGVRIIILPTIKHKYFDTVVHTFLSVGYAFFRESYDVILICNSANSIFSFIPKLRGQKVALNVDGLEWQRKKWNIIGKIYYRISEFLATILASEIVTDSEFIQEYYLRRFHRSSTFIPYGTTVEKVSGQSTLRKYHLKSREYILYVSRLEPENNAHLVVEAFERVRTNKKLVIVGDAPYNFKYIQELKSTKDPRILFTGYVFGKGYKELQSHAYFYVQATEVGGTHPALVESMGFGNCVLANDVATHREVLGDSGIYFSTQHNKRLIHKMQYLLDNPSVVNCYQKKTKERVLARYTWDRIVREYEQFFLRLARRR